VVRKEGEPISPTERGQQGPNKNSPGGTNGAIQKRAHSFFFGDVSIVFKFIKGRRYCLINSICKYNKAFKPRTIEYIQQDKS
jgi:hypothetical protein